MQNRGSSRTAGAMGQHTKYVLGLTIVLGWFDIYELAHEVVQLHVPEALACMVHLEVRTKADEGGLSKYSPSQCFMLNLLALFYFCAQPKSTAVFGGKKCLFYTPFLIFKFRTHNSCNA